MDQIREQMGVCPQKDIFMDQLSAQEHLEFFAELKGSPPSPPPPLLAFDLIVYLFYLGVSRTEVQAAVEKVFHEVNLEGHEKKMGNKLSGGQKRKLCLGMALIGNPKLILLDEPTSGMDPYSRHSFI